MMSKPDELFSNAAKTMNTNEIEYLVNEHECKVKTIIPAAEKFAAALGQRIKYIDDVNLVGKKLFLYDFEIRLMYDKPAPEKNTLWLYHAGCGVINASYKPPLHEIMVSRYINGEWEKEFMRYARNPDKYIQLIKSKKSGLAPKKDMSPEEIKKRNKLIAKAKRLGLKYI